MLRARFHLLIVDDDQDAREMYAWCMRAAGWIVEAVTNGADALDAALQFEPDVIVMDLRLPGGLDAIRRLKAMDETRDIPILAVTAFNPATSEAEARAAGSNAFVAKPFDAEVPRLKVQALVTEDAPPSS